MTYSDPTANNSFEPPKSVVTSVVSLTVVKYPLIPLASAPIIISPGAGGELFITLATYLFSFK
uniref:Uncharacterized protein n=1 Tax=uncultured marine virus TaxID=186617 RepID=A0A0F7LAQ0_9VIRU|nr:hypothetical protein [uncultured marine virus]